MIKKLNKSKAHQIYKLADGSRIPGCSSVVKYGPPADGIIGWAYKCGRKGEDFNKVRDLASDIGTCAHFLIEAYLFGDEADLSDFSPNAVTEATHAFGNFKTLWEEGELEAIKGELQLVSERHRFGGTLDLVCLDREKRRTLLDFKVTGGIFPNHIWQLSGYEELHNENFPSTKIERRAILRIPKEPGDSVEPKWISPMAIEKAFDVFKAQLSLYNAVRNEKL